MKRLSIILMLFIVGSLPVYAVQVTESFGWRIHPLTGKSEFHRGIDIAGKYGSPIYAVFGGDVVWAAPFKGYGNTVLLHHSKNRYTLYGHCSAIFVRRGQKVTTGERIAYVGSTGISTGPHLHLEYWVNNRYVDPLVIWQMPSRNSNFFKNSR